MPVANKPPLNTFRWAPDWVTRPKIAAVVDNAKAMLYQVIQVDSPSDLIGRAGVSILIKPDPSKPDIPLASKGLWLIGNDLWSILVNFQAYIPNQNNNGNFNPNAQPYELTYEQGRAVANYIELAGVIAHEGVGEGYLREHGWQTSGNHVSAFEQGMAARIKERFASEAPNRKPYFKCNYGAFYTFRHRMKFGFRIDGTTVPPTHSYFKSLLQNRAVARQSCPFWQLNYDELGMVHDMKFYLEDFESRRDFYMICYVAEVCRFATLQDNGLPRNRNAFHFWVKVEQLPEQGITWAIHNLTRYRREIPSKGGHVVTTEHPQADHELFVAGCLFVIAIGVIAATGETINDDFHWENSEIYGNNPEYMTEPNPFPNQERANLVRWRNNDGSYDTNAPYNPAIKGYPESPMGYMSIAPKAIEMYQTTAATAGVEWRDGRYKCIERNGSPVDEPWVEPKADKTTILDIAAMYDGYNATGPGKVRGGLALKLRDKSANGQRNLSMMWYHAGRNPDVFEKYLVEPWSGKQITIDVQGATCEVFNESYPV